MASAISQWDGSDGTNILSHVSQVEAYFIAKGVDDEAKKVALLHLSLKGKPKTFFSELTSEQKATFDAAKAQLVARFKPSKSAAQFQQELADRRQQGDETAFQLKFEIQHLVTKAYPEVSAPDAREALISAHFRKALKPEIRSKLAWALPDDASLDDLVKRAAQIEREGKSTEIGALSAADVDIPGGRGMGSINTDIWQKLDELSRGQQMLASTVAAIQTQNHLPPVGRSRNSTRQPGTCFQCNVKGHYARDCPQRRQQNTTTRAVFQGKCFQCGQWGHRAAGCPAPSLSNQGND